ncbi:hypothetical protein BJV78DRAFT_257516 [Lactifluus subvellereus]|nr:hypothetical protein BJV78DRAFT_257516 [Lactifluus subvellereus]
MGLLATIIPITLRQGALAVATNLRVTSMSIAAYDYFLILPWEYRLYKSSDKRRLGLILFILMRYSSVILMVISNVGFFYHDFSPKSCGHYYHVASIFKVMVSQAILGVRTYCISLHNIWVGRIILSTYVIVVGFQWFSNSVHFIPVMTNGNCVPGRSRPDLLASTWSFYLAAMLFDCLVISISTVYLLKMRVAGVSAASRLANILLYDGLGYWVALTAVNMMNVFLERDIRYSIQASGVSLGYAVTWIMSQRILIHPHDAGVGDSVIITQLPVPSVPVMPHELLRSSSAHRMVNSHGYQIGKQRHYRKAHPRLSEICSGPRTYRLHYSTSHLVYYFSTSFSESGYISLDVLALGRIYLRLH